MLDQINEVFANVVAVVSTGGGLNIITVVQTVIQIPINIAILL